MVFMDTTATIPTGAMAERWKFSSFVLFSFVISMIIYPIYANWVWGGGWLSQLGTNFGLGHGHVDFAGSSVVHMTGGVAALVGAKMLGPRIGKYRPDGTANADPRPQHPDGRARHVHPRVRLVRLQPRLHAGGHRHAHRDHRGQHHARVGRAARSAPRCYMKLRFGKPDPSMLCNGMLAGLVAITAPCAFVTAPVAIFIGAVAGVLVVVVGALRREHAQDRRPGRRRRRSTASAAPGASSRSGCSPTAVTATAGTACRAR